MNNAFEFLISTALSLLTMAFVLRVWMQIVQANYFSPLAEAIRKITNPVINPIRKVIPSFGKVDTGAILVAYLLVALKIFLLNYDGGNFPPLVPVLIASVKALLVETLSLMFWILIIRAIMSWFSNGSNPLEYVLMELTEPMLRPIRRVLPPMGGLDLSVLILIVAIQFFRIALQ